MTSAGNTVPHESAPLKLCFSFSCYLLPASSVIQQPLQGPLTRSAIGFSAWFCISFCNLFIFFSSAKSPAVYSKHKGCKLQAPCCPWSFPLQWSSLVRTCTCHQATVPCTGIDSDGRKIHCISKNTQFPVEDNMTLTCLIIFKGWGTPIANNQSAV